MAPARSAAVFGFGQRRLGDGVDPRHPGQLGGPVGGQPRLVVGAGLRPWPPAVVGVVHVELGHDRERVGLVGHRRVDDLVHEHALARVGGHAHPPVADAPLGVGQGHERPAAGIAEQHDGLRPASTHLVGDGLHVDGARLVETIGVVAHVPGAKAAHGVAGRRQQRAGVVNAEITAGVAEDHGRLPGPPAWRKPQEPSHQGAVRGYQPDRLARDVDAGVVFGQRPVAVAERTPSAKVNIESLHGAERSPRTDARSSLDQRTGTPSTSTVAFVS